MLNNYGKALEKRVLDVYQKENPSTYKIEESRELHKKIEDYAYRLYTHSLKLLPKIFDGANLLEFGSGTGERSMNYLRWGANCTFVEFNKKAISRAKSLYSEFSPNGSYRFENCSLFDFDSEQKFDITISNAVIHHTAEKEKAFQKLVSYLRPGGINVLGIGTTGACIQRNLQRLIIYTFTGDDEVEIESIANKLFKEHLERAEKFGNRTRKAIIYDTYINPKLDFISIAELLSWYKKYNLTFYSSWPPVIPSILGDDLGGKTDWRDFPEVLSYSEWIWGTQITQDRDFIVEIEEMLKPRTSTFRDMANSINDIQAENIDLQKISYHVQEVIDHEDLKDSINLRDLRKFQNWLSDLKLLLKALDEKDLNKVSELLNRSNFLFRGKGGLGLNYFAAIKN